MHAAGIQFDYAFLVGQTAQPDRIVVGIVLRALHHSDPGFERVAAAFEEGVCGLDVIVAVIGADNDRALG